MTDRRDTRLGAHVLAWVLLALTTALLFWLSFERWGDPIIDLGRDLYLPSQILEGRTLYRDLLYNYGPVTPYLLAGLVALFGDNLWVFEMVGVVIGLATMAGLYAIGAGLGIGLGRVWLGSSAAFLFALLSFFANSTWGANFVLPYSFAATLATACAVWSFYFLTRYLYGQSSLGLLVWSVVFLYATAFTKVEVGVGIAVVHIAAWWAHRLPRRAIALIVGAGVLLGLLFVGTFAGRGEAEHELFAENLAKFAGTGAGSSFFGVVAGLDRPLAHLVRALGSLEKIALILFLAGYGGRLMASAGGGGVDSRSGPKRFLPVVLAALCVVACGWLIWMWAGVRLFQATPLLALGVAVLFALRDRKDPLLLLAVFALFGGLRILLQFHPLWYGFYLAIPAYPFLVYLLGARVPGWLPESWHSRRAVVVGLAVLAAVVLWRFENPMLQSFDGKTTIIRSAKGSLRDEASGRGEAIQGFLQYAAERLDPSTRMVVLPEGVSLNYFTGFRNPTAYYLFTPPEIGSPAVERRMIRELDAEKPEILVLTSRDLTEYGRRGIGLDYALELGDWIRESYDLERVFETGEDSTWRLLLLRRRES